MDLCEIPYLPRLPLISNILPFTAIIRPTGLPAASDGMIKDGSHESDLPSQLSTISDETVVLGM